MGRRRRRRSRGNRGSGGESAEQKLIRLADLLSDYTPIQPEARLQLETTQDEPIGRLMDLITPIGRGQRVLVTSPPKAGKTTILQAVAKAVHHNHPEIDQVALLVDERPEEATDFRRNLPIPVRASTTDRTPAEHIALAEQVFVESMEKLFEGKDVLILLDSLTRLARAYNTNYGNSGRTLSGGVTAGALDRPRQLFGAARAHEEGGSLTIVATALIDTGSRMDEVIFQEFKGTGNCEIVLDRELAQRRLWPAVDIGASGTRNEARLLDGPDQEEHYTKLRRKLADYDKQGGLDWVLGRLKRTTDNRDLLLQLL